MASFDLQFLSTFLRRQPFGLPDSMIYYILKNPKSSKVYQKLIQCCKYFFIKNPILVLHCLHIDDDGWTICTNQTNCKDNFHQTFDNRIITSCCKLWIDHQIRIYPTDSKVASDLLPSIYQCDSTKSFFINQKMSLQQFLFYAQKAEELMLINVIISSDIGAEIPLEEIIANVPNILRTWIEYGDHSRNVSSNTAKKLLEIPYFKKVTEFCVYRVSEEFDIDSIYDYYKKNRPQFKFEVTYRNEKELSEAKAKKFEGIVDDILGYEKLYSL